MTDAERNLLIQVAAAVAGMASGTASVPMKAGSNITFRYGFEVAALLENLADAVRAEQQQPPVP